MGIIKMYFVVKSTEVHRRHMRKKIFIWRSPDRILVIGLYGFDANIVIEIFYNNRLIQLLPNKIFWLKKGIRALKFGDFFFKIFDSV